MKARQFSVTLSLDFNDEVDEVALARIILGALQAPGVPAGLASLTVARKPVSHQLPVSSVLN